MLDAVLFDLDGTLLDIDLDMFLQAYFSLLGPVVADVIGNGISARDALQAVIAGTEAMTSPHPGLSNRDAFNRSFRHDTGVDLGDVVAAEHLERFYEQQFPSLKGGYGPVTGADAVLAVARRHGLRLALATNPIFPLSAIEERMRWGGIASADFDLVTSYENMHACKPLPHYYRSIAECLGVEPDRCLMVGDDPVLDMAAADVGMRTFYVGTASGAVADWHGSLADLAALLPRLVAQ